MFIEQQRSRPARACFVLVALLVATASSLAGAKDKARPAAKYVGHMISVGGAPLIIQIKAFTPDDVAERVALAGRGGNANAIREALGKEDCGFMKIRDQGFRIAYARSQTEPEGTRVILIFRHELPYAGLSSLKEFDAPPLAAGDLFIPTTGAGSAVVSTLASVTFRSVDDVSITDWGGGWLEAQDLKAARE